MYNKKVVVFLMLISLVSCSLDAKSDTTESQIDIVNTIEEPSEVSEKTDENEMNEETERETIPVKQENVSGSQWDNLAETEIDWASEMSGISDNNISQENEVSIESNLEDSPIVNVYKEDDLKSRLTPIQYEVTQNWATEKAYQNPYWDTYEDGIYVDIIDGTALFSSTTKFKSWTGWPSFTKPISSSSIVELEDNLLWYTRTEVKSSASNSHLWHIFSDGPKDEGWLRYCINSASLRFIGKKDMKEEWYGEYLYLFDDEKI